MDNFTIGAIGLSLILSRYLRNDNKKSNFTQIEGKANVGAPNEAVRSAIIIKDTETIKRLLNKVTDPIIKANATRFLRENCNKDLTKEKDNWNNFKERALESYKDRPIKDYIHNNFVPFGKKMTQNMAGTGVKTGNYTHGSGNCKPGVINSGFDDETPFSQKLGQYTGRDSNNPSKTKAHTPRSLFKPQESERSNVNGAPLYRPNNDRFTPGSKRHDLKPVQSTQVGPGLGIPADQPHHGTGSQHYRIDDRGITSVKTTRGTESGAPVPGKDQSSAGKGHAAFAEGLNSETLETFTQNKGSAFVNNKCNSFVTTENRPGMANTTLVDAPEKRADFDHRGDTQRGTEGNYLGPGGSVIPMVSTNLSSFKSDNHNIHSSRESYSFGMLSGHMNNGPSQNDNSSWYVNKTDRGEDATDHTGFSGSSVNSTTKHYPDSARVTHRQGFENNDMRNIKGSSAFSKRNDNQFKKTQRGSEISTFGQGASSVSGQMSVNNYNAAQGSNNRTDSLHASRPSLGRSNIVGSANERMQNINLNQRGETSTARFNFNHDSKQDFTLGNSQIKTTTGYNTNRDPLIGRTMSGINRLLPSDSRENCKSGAA